ncbi:TonB-dependent receptor [Stenotrophomonas daejeonensis]|uniref:TonB-dependent receptor n=1 Tax=Stenotrophomonas daejeonensis TaxID=659018 RepID=A0A0R0DGE4_9GAMM|nr:TonB-dependent receptor [Stenotrophomonas daejeonensis]KRG80693.1 TonB-dependent receptor [Stenotrophomonas daejeonensis]
MTSPKRSNLSVGIKRTALSIALGMCFAGAVNAQSVTGTIYGQAAAEAGTTVLIENTDTGQSRTIAVDANGRYRAPSLPNGNYKVTLMKDGQPVSVREGVRVVIASGTEVSFVAAASSGAVDLDRITVNATSVPSIDVSQVDTRTVFTAEELQKFAIPRDIAAVAMLAPSVVKNDSYGVPSFGGSASSENAYYINGYAVTNPLTSIGFTTLPFDAIAQEQILTGGYGAEFGRATGGVINIVTKRGTNEWKGGVYTIYSPKPTREDPRNYYYPNTGNFPATDGKLLTYRQKNTSWENTTGVYVGGPLVKDKLFVYADAELTRREGEGVAASTSSAPGAAGGFQDYRYDYPRWTAKVDWNITDNHILELTGVSDVTKYSYDGYAYDYDTFSHGSEKNAGTTDKDDARLYVAKYTGYITDNLTLSALYGQQKITHESSPWGLDPSCPYVAAAVQNRAPGFDYSGCWSTDRVNVPGENEKTEGGRFDITYQLGRHELRAGYDRQDAEAFTGSEYQGGYVWVYSRMLDNAGNPSPMTPIDTAHGVGAPGDVGGTLADQGYYVRRQYYTQEANVKTEQEAFYIEDRWQVTDNFMLNLGLRNEQFTNFNGDGKAYIKQSNQWAPRLGAVWDVRGDSSLKVFANAGRYHLALPNNVAVRAASGSLYTLEYFTYTGVDPVTGAPTGITNIPVTDLGYSCAGNPNAISSNLECGQSPDPKTVAAKGIKSHFQDEYIIGFEHQPWDTLAWGAKFTYRDLRSAIDDTCTQALGGGCFLFNPGEGNSFYEEQADGSLALHHYTAEELNLPKLKRKYVAVDLFVEHPFTNNFYGKLSYTWSRNFGNTEGQLASDLDTGSGGQSDVSVTQDWDLPQLMEGANGLLPNDRTHQIKGTAYYTFSPEWTVGGSLIAASGRPRSCTSYYPTWPAPTAGIYNGSYYHYCGLPGNPSTNTPPSDDYKWSQRGSYGRAPWTIQFNLNVSYRPAWMDNLTLSADVINLFNQRVPTFYNDNYASSATQHNNMFGRELNYTTPRYMRFTARYDF